MVSCRRRQAKRAEGELTETQKAHITYWSGLVLAANNRYEALARRKAYKGTWQTAESLTVNGDLYMEFNASRSQKGLRAEAYIGGPLAKVAFDWMKGEIIENDLLPQLDISWERLDRGRDCRIACYWPQMPSTQSEGHDREYDFFIRALQDLAQVCKALGRSLREDPTPLQVDSALQTDV